MTKKLDFSNHVIETHVQGIPCFAMETFYDPGHPGRGLRGELGSYQDILAPEPEIVEFELYDRKGYRAEWLKDKMTDEDRERIERELLERDDEY